MKKILFILLSLFSLSAFATIKVETSVTIAETTYEKSFVLKPNEFITEQEYDNVKIVITATPRGKSINLIVCVYTIDQDGKYTQCLRDESVKVTWQQKVAFNVPTADTVLSAIVYKM